MSEIEQPVENGSVPVAPMAPLVTDVQVERAPLPTNHVLKEDLIADVAQFQGPVWTQKSDTGFVGIVNQGNTCYLNSLIQCLFMTPDFRAHLFNWQYKGKEIHGSAERNIPLQLQYIFARLRLSKRGAVTTNDLTRSFFWDKGEAFHQHDVQELLRVLFDACSKTFQKDGTEDILNMFEGTLTDYLDCQECHHPREKEDTFQDLSVVIQGKTTLLEALDNFVEPEILSGDNQYFCDVCQKKVDCKKGLKFKSLPMLLFIQLKRFVFDWAAMKRNKLYNRVEYAKKVDLSKYVNQEEGTMIYDLYGVIVHMGTAMGGHYIAYCQELETQMWLKFNDSNVTEMKEEEFEKAFGGKEHASTGYVLLYRNRDVPMPEKESIRADIINYIQEEDAKIEAEFEASQKARRTITIRVHCNNRQEPLRCDQAEVTVGELTTLVRNTFDLDVKPDNLRLRKFDKELNFAGAVLESKTEDEIIKDVGLTRSCDLMVEIREDGKDFAKVDPDAILVRIVSIDDQKTIDKLIDEDLTCHRLETYNLCLDEMKDVLSITINKDETISNLSNLYAKAKDCDPSLVQVLRILGNRRIEILPCDHILSKCGVVMGSVLLFEVMEEDKPYSKFARAWEEARLKIHLGYNIPLKEKPDRVSFDKLIRISQVEPMRNLKVEIARELGLSVDQFRIKKGTRGKELKDQEKTLEEYGLKDGSIVYLEFGRPAQPDEISFIFRLYDPEKKLTDPGRGKKSFCDLIEFPFPKDMTVAALKRAIVEVLNVEMPAKDGNQFGIKFARIRKMKGARIAEILYDANKLCQYGFQDGTKLAVQMIPLAETFSRKHLSLFFQHYRADVPPYGKLSNTKEEMVIEKDALVRDLKKLISERFNIELSNLLIERGRMTSVMTSKSVYALRWNDLPDDASINRMPLMLRNGQIVIFQDKTVVLTEEQIQKVEEERKAQAAQKRSRLKRNPNYKPASASRERRPERALIIRTESEVFAIEKAEEEKKALKADEEKKAVELVDLKEPEEEAVEAVTSSKSSNQPEMVEKPVVATEEV